MKRSKPAPVTSSRTISVSVPLSAGRACLISALVCAIALWLLIGLNSEALHVPFNHGGDALVQYSLAKNIGSGHWWWDNPRLGMPFGADWRDFPVYNTPEYALIGLLSIPFHDPFLVLNLAWLLLVVLTAAFCAFSLVKLDLDPLVSVGISLVYALQPFTWWRNVVHFNLTFPLIALVLGYLVNQTAAGVDGEAASKVPRYVWLAAVGIGLSSTYNAFFTCCVLVVAAGIAVVSQRRWQASLSAMGIAALIVASFVVNISPSLYYWAKEGKTSAVVYKAPADADRFGLRLRTLILPVGDHKIAPLRELSLRFDRDFHDDNEAGSARLGLVGAAGFLYLVYVVLFGRFLPQAARSNLTTVLAVFVLALLLLSVVGGFGSIFNGLVAPDIRAYNRTVVYIGYFSLTAVALLLSRWKRRWNTPAAVGVLSLFTLLAVLDEASPNSLQLRDSRSSAFYADRAFGQKVDAQFPAGAKIFQIPHTAFPVDFTPNVAQVYANAVPYLHTDHVSWSWGAVSGRHFDWGTGMAALPPAAMVVALREAGFAGLWVNGDGLTSPASMVRDVTAAVGKPVVVHTQRNQLVFDLRGSQPPPGKGLTDAALARSLYRDFFDREPDEATVAGATSRLRNDSLTGPQLAEQYLHSAEFLDTGIYAATCYLVLLDREPDYEGWASHSGILRRHNGTKESDIAAFLGSGEYTRRIEKQGDEPVSRLYARLGLTAPPASSTSPSNCLAKGTCAALAATLSQSEFQAATIKRLHRKLLYYVLMGKEPGIIDGPIGKSSGDIDTEMVQLILKSKEYADRH